MALSYFDDKEHQPTEDDLTSALGETKPLWDGIAAYCTEKFAPLTIDWKFFGAKWGWSCKLVQKKRVILYLTHADGFYYTGFVLGDKALNALRRSELPANVLDVINSAPKYGEGTGFRLEIRTKQDLEATEVLADAKMGS
ncbi:MAG: DUF3788 family protein [bacterium]